MEGEMDGVCLREREREGERGREKERGRERERERGREGERDRMMDVVRIHAVWFKYNHLQEPHVLFDLDHLVHHDIAVQERGGRPSSASPIIPHDLCLHLKENLERSRKGQVPCRFPLSRDLWISRPPSHLFAQPPSRVGFEMSRPLMT